MQSFTYMSDEAVSAVIEAFDASTDSHYPMSLNRSDFAMFVRALQLAYAVDSDESREVGEWAGDWLSSVGETLGVEFV